MLFIHVEKQTPLAVVETNKVEFVLGLNCFIVNTFHFLKGRHHFHFLKGRHQIHFLEGRHQI